MTRTLLFIDSFDMGNPTVLGPKWQYEAWAGFGSGRFGSGRSWYVTGSGLSPQKQVVTPGVQGLHIGFGFKKTVMGVAGYVMRLEEAINGTVHFGLALDTAGQLYVTRGTTTVATATTPAIPPDTWTHIELRVWIDNSVGRITVKVNGATGIDFTGDTQNAGTGVVSAIYIQNSSNNGALYYDDLYVYSITDFAADPWVGDARIFSMSPDSVGNYSQWSPISGSVNYQNVDEQTTDGDTTYVFASVSGTMDSYGFSDMSASGTVTGIVAWWTARKDDAGTRMLAPLCRRNSIDALGTAFALADGYALYNQVWEVDPTISGSWSLANLNATEFGMKLVG